VIGTSQEIGWKDQLWNDSWCVDRDIKLYSFQLNSSQLKLHVITSCRHWLLHCMEAAAFLCHTA